MWLVGVIACQRSGTADAVATAAFRKFAVDSGTIEIALSAPELVALGDTTQAEVLWWFQCASRQCGSQNARRWPADSASWHAEPASAADVNAHGQIIPRHVGFFRLMASRGDTLLVRRIEVLPPVAQLAWESAPQRVLMGDTIRATAVARDSAGRVVRTIPLYTVDARGGSVRYETLPRAGSPATQVIALGPGELRLIARLGSRSATWQTFIDVPVFDSDLPILKGTTSADGGNACQQLTGQRPDASISITDTVAWAAWQRGFARGGEYRCVIHAKIPPIRIVLVKDTASGTFDGYIEPDAANGPPWHIPRDSLLFEMEEPLPRIAMVQMLDLDADGYGDLLVENMWGATGNTLYQVWRFNRHLRQFIADDELTGESNLSPVPGIACVYTDSNGGGANETARRCLRNGHWVTDSLFTSRWAPKAKAVIEEVQARRGDRLVVVKRTVRPDSIQ